MARLSAHGRTQVAEAQFFRESHDPNVSYTTTYRLMSDGTVLGNIGYGWTIKSRGKDIEWFRLFARNANSLHITRESA